MKRELTILLIFLVLATSCKKYLDKKSDNSLTTIDRLEDLQALLNNDIVLNKEIIPIYGEVSSADYFIQPDNPELHFDAAFKPYTWQYFLYDYVRGNDWSKGYNAVNIANICLEEINKFPLTSVNSLLWNNIKGSALFIRAFNFLNLSAIYAKAYDSVTSATDQGIALRLGTDAHIATVRASVADSYDQVIKDAKESILYLPDIGIHPSRPCKAAAYGLLARAYLWMRVYDSALVYADKCLQIKSDLMDYNGDGDIVNNINGLAPPFKQYNKETIFYADMISSSLYNNVIAIGNIDTLLYTMYDNDDLRKVAFFTRDLADLRYQKFKGPYTQIIFSLFGGIATDEMFLMRAECYARKDRVLEAMNDLNTLLAKRWKNTVPYPTITAVDATDALNKILAERRKELLFRGLRWMDIKRLNKEDAGIVLKRIVGDDTYELLPNSDKYALPIPQDIIDITGIPQNGGWQ